MNFLWSGTCDITQKSDKFISLKFPDSDQVVNNLIKQCARVYEVVKCLSPRAALIKVNGMGTEQVSIDGLFLIVPTTSYNNSVPILIGSNIISV